VAERRGEHHRIVGLGRPPGSTAFPRPFQFQNEFLDLSAPSVGNDVLARWGEPAFLQDPEGGDVVLGHMRTEAASLHLAQKR